MAHISRREFAGYLAAAGAAAAADSEIDPGLISRHDDAVALTLTQQVTDPASKYRGSSPDGYGLHTAQNAGSIVTLLTTAYLQPKSKYANDAAVLDRIRLAAGYLERAQSPDGNIDLLSTNFNSPPDTGFVVHGVGSAASLAAKAQNRQVLGILEPFLTRAGAAMARGGVHTPNHRWVVSSALAQIHEVYPNPAYTRRIEQWLAEGIDIDNDGQFTERSTGVYNAVCDRAFVVLAAKLKNADLLDPVRKNLNSMLYLLHPNGEVVTEISRRQDQYDRKDMSPYWFPLQFLAVYDNDGRFAALANSVAPRAASLTALMEYPELRRTVKSAALPDDYEKFFPELKVARIRRGRTSATILLGGDSHFASFHRGEAVIASIRFASSFFGKGQFVPASGAKDGGSYELKQQLEAGYYQPLDVPHEVKAGQWGSTRGERKRTEISELTQSATITETKTGLKIRMRSGGTAGVPVAVEIALREGGKLEGCEAAHGAHILAKGYATYKVGDDVARFGPGLREHSYLQVRGAESPAPGMKVYLCGFTPFDHELEIG